MSKLRSISTSIWSDPFFEELTPSEKLLFIYLITNEKTNMLGIYELSIRKISFETGLKKDVINEALRSFERQKKVKYTSEHIILTNFIKNQNYNTNMKKSAIEVFNKLPKSLKDSDLTLDKRNPLEAFKTLSNHLGMVSKYEYEYEYESKDELEEKKINKKNTPTAQFSFFESLIEIGVERELANDWLKVRKNKKATNTRTAFNNLKQEFEKCGKPINEIITKCVAESWSGFKNSWDWEKYNNNGNNNNNNQTRRTNSSDGYKVATVDEEKLLRELAEDAKNGNIPGVYSTFDSIRQDQTGE